MALAMRGLQLTGRRPQERHACAAPLFAVDGHLAAVVAHDLADDGQPEPGALTALLGGEEGIEDTRQILRRDAAAVVLDLDAHAIPERRAAGLGSGAQDDAA